MLTQVADTLKRNHPSTVAAGPARWNVALPLGAGDFMMLRVCIEDDWLCFEAPLPDVPSGGACDLLQANSALQGAARFVLAQDRSARLRAEISLDDPDLDLDAPLRCALADCRSALARIHGGARGPEETGPDNIGPAEVEVGDLARLCGQTGWRFAERAPGRLMADLEVAFGFCQATVETREGRVRLGIELVTAPAPMPESREACARFLLTASGLLRLARATGRREGERLSAGLEIDLPARPTPAELAHGLGALSVGVQLAGREARALMDAAVARKYLART